MPESISARRRESRRQTQEYDRYRGLAAAPSRVDGDFEAAVKGLGKSPAPSRKKKES